MRADARQRLDDLLLARATEGLSAADALELERLLAAHSEADEGGYDRAAAAVSLAALGARGPMPRGLRVALERRATEFAAGRAKGGR